MAAATEWVDAEKTDLSKVCMRVDNKRWCAGGRNILRVFVGFPEITFHICSSHRKTTSTGKERSVTKGKKPVAEAAHVRSSGRTSDAIDIEVGRRVRIRRLLKHMSQKALASELGVTFQQIQKYEKGVTRISASKLKKISTALDTSIRFFFQSDDEKVRESEEESVIQLIPDRDAMLLMRAFSRISDPAMRRTVVAHVENLASIAEVKGSE